jgi:hypothetical protein
LQLNVREYANKTTEDTEERRGKERLPRRRGDAEKSKAKVKILPNPKNTEKIGSTGELKKEPRCERLKENFFAASHEPDC